MRPVRKFPAASSAAEEVRTSCLCAVLIEVRGEVWYDGRCSENRNEKERGKREGREREREREMEKVAAGWQVRKEGGGEKNAITTLDEELAGKW